MKTSRKKESEVKCSLKNNLDVKTLSVAVDEELNRLSSLYGKDKKVVSDHRKIRAQYGEAWYRRSEAYRVMKAAQDHFERCDANFQALFIKLEGSHLDQILLNMP